MQYLINYVDKMWIKIFPHTRCQELQTPGVGEGLICC